MYFITLDSETDFDGWRKSARALALNEIEPSDVRWMVGGSEGGLSEQAAPDPLQIPQEILKEIPQGTFNVSAKFVELAQSAILHRDRALCHSVSIDVAAAR
jgi:DNA polymerase